MLKQVYTHMNGVHVRRQQKGACRPVRVNGARDITRLMSQTAIQVGNLCH